MAEPARERAKRRRCAATRARGRRAAPEGAATADRLTRLLCLVPLAAREGGIRLDELAAALGVTVEDVREDLQEFAERAYYQLAGPGDDFQVHLEAERVEIWTKGELRRPPRLSPPEALALGLGLRALALEAAPGPRGQVLDLARYLERALAVAPPEAWVRRYAIAEGDLAGAELRALLARAARDGVRCRLRYLKPSASAPDERQVRPYAVAAAEGWWYLIAHDEARRAVRLFRIDRILEATVTGEAFEPPAGFDPTDYLEHGRAYRADQEIEVIVRYSSRIARWIAERERVERCRDGTVLVRHRVADPDWIVRGVLYYGGEAEVLEPAWLRAEIASHGQRIAQRADHVGGPRPGPSRARRPGPARGHPGSEWPNTHGVSPSARSPF